MRKTSKELVKMELKMVSIDKIDISEGNVRRRKITEGIDELKKSIQRIGLQQPPMVFQKKDRYELIIGQRRLVAMKELGWKTIPVLVRGSFNIMEAKIASLSENIQRVSLPARDMSDVCNYLLEQFGTVDAVAEGLGVSPQTVEKYLGYRIVPEPLKKMVDKGKITAPDAIKITLHVPDEKKAVKIARKMSEMTRPEKERIVDILQESPEEPVSQIVKIAEEAKLRKKFIIHLPDKYAKAVGKAALELDLEPDDIVKTAVTDWLHERGYV